ncbi:hypothetical protein Poly51_03710 [Rubripirellula tenax]|uniref:DUF2059 domain-containing protein n=1 Tax=Rubripirellula tenax TaxID=2528015 RepID=A0A5C6FJ25_9BACT|nr:DUF2059 domain-containing protein [Rubripirellula tenax]TWU60097.1 hypothetical protein Poly51_03710 [Rubripirellula tenax]
MKTRLTFALCIALANASFSIAQDAAPVADAPVADAPVADKTAAVATANDSSADAPQDSHAAAIEEFLVTMRMEETTRRSIDQMLAMQIQQNPQMEMFADVMKAFLQKHLSFDKIKGEMITIYRDTFTEDEIRQLTAFYQTPVGRKAAERLPALAAASAQIGGKRVQANMAELQAAMAKKQAEMQAEGIKEIAPE